MTGTWSIGPSHAMQPDMVVVPAGSFQMGASDDEEGREDCETPRHLVTFARPFALSRTPVTFAQWDWYQAQGGTAYRPDDEGWGRADRPVINVCWEDARSFVSWLAERTGHPYRLPSESEWEYAARGGTDRAFHWGDSFAVGCANCLDGQEPWTGRMTSPVGSYPANAFGFSDMLGNVWEWVEDCWNEFYRRAPIDGTPWSAGVCEARVLRGGSWCDPARLVRAAARNRNGRHFRCNDYSFRVALDLAP